MRIRNMLSKLIGWQISTIFLSKMMSIQETLKRVLHFLLFLMG